MKKYFNSNETLEMCDVKVGQDGRIDIETNPCHATELERLGNPGRAIRGRVVMEEGNLHFAPYAENSRRPTFSKQVHVSSATLSVTADKVKLSFMIPRHLTKQLMLMYIQSEIDEVKRRLEADVYDMLAKASNVDDNVNADAKRASIATTEALALQRSGACDLNGRPDGKVNVSVNVNVEKEGGIV